MKLLTDIILNTVNAVMMIYVFVFFFKSFCTYRIPSIHRFIVVVLASVAMTLTLLFAENRLFRVPIIVLIAFFASLMFSSKWYNRILLSFSAIAIPSVAEMLVALIQSLLFSVDWQENAEGLLFIMGVFLSKIVAILLIIIIRSRINPKFSQKSIRETLIISLIPFSSVAIITLMCFYLESLSNADDSFIMITLICSTLFTFLNMVVFSFVDHLYQDAEKDAQLLASKEIINQQELQYQQLIESNREIMQLRHDHNNFALGLISEIESGNYSSALNSLYKQVITIKESSDLAQNQGVIHLLIKQKTAKAAENGIEIEFIYHELQKIIISHIDLSIIVGNALDNAIEASQRLTSSQEKKVTVQIKVHNDNIVIIIKNNVIANVDINNLHTTKREKGRHGFGIASIKQLVEKYEGDVVFTCENLIFEARIMLRNCND